jgi:hypothetical protein
MKVLGFGRFLLYFLSRRKIRIYVLRGGLGNQLFQIANGIMTAERFNFDIAFHEVDVKRNPRDQIGAASLEFPFHLLTEKIHVYKCGSSMQFPIRFSMSRFFKMTLSTNLDEKQKAPNQKSTFRILQGYVQNLDFLDSFADIAICRIILGPNSEENIVNGIAMHIRARDGLEHSGMSISKSFYERALEAVAAKPESRIDVFSDDLDFAQDFCQELGNFQFNFVEESVSLSATELLRRFSCYEKIISSKSTLSWWACFLASSTRKDTVVISPWGVNLSFRNWRVIAP